MNCDAPLYFSTLNLFCLLFDILSFLLPVPLFVLDVETSRNILYIVQSLSFLQFGYLNMRDESN